MASHATQQRPEPARSATWPLEKMQPSQSNSTPPETQAFKDDLEQHPERHFLSPMTAEECYGWDSDSDDEDDGGDWNAGITDFSLFAADRKRATETGEPLDQKWDAFVSNQAEAFGRTVERVRESESEEVPGLTPDASPNLRDDLEDEDEREGRFAVPQIQMPNYLTVEVKPANVDERGGAIVGPNDELPLSFWFVRKKRVERPGLRHARTMSGRRHVWRRPDNDIFTVGEDVGAEEEAEREHDELRPVSRMEALGFGAK